MSFNIVRKGFAFPTGTLLRDAQLLLTALHDETVGPPLMVHLSATFVADFTAQIALATQLGIDQGGAFGSVSELTSSLYRARLDVHRCSVVARRAAKLVFAGRPTILRSEFQVGVTPTRGIPGMLEWNRKLLAACRRYADELAPFGWTPASADKFQAAIDILADADRDQLTAMDDKLGLTVGRKSAANRLYRQCVAVQNAARMVYGGVDDLANPAAVSARARFLLDAFPPRLRTVAAILPPADATPVAEVPATTAV